MVVATDARPVFFLPFVAFALAALLDNPEISLSASAGSDLPTWVGYRLGSDTGWANRGAGGNRTAGLSRASPVWF